MKCLVFVFTIDIDDNEEEYEFDNIKRIPCWADDNLSPKLINPAPKKINSLWNKDLSAKKSTLFYMLCKLKTILPQ